MPGLSLILTDLDELERILWANPDGTCITVRNDIGAYELILGGVRFLAPLAAGSADLTDNRVTGGPTTREGRRKSTDRRPSHLTEAAS